LPVGEQACAGVQRPVSPVERIAGTPSVPVQVLLDPAPAPVQGVAGQTDDVEGVHHRHRGGELSGGGGLEAGEPVHGDNLETLAPSLRPLGEPGLERLLGAALDHVQQPRGTCLVADRGETDSDGDELVAAAGVAPHVLVDADDCDAIEAGRGRRSGRAALGPGGVVGGVPGHRQCLGEAGDGKVLADQPEQSPSQGSQGQLGARLGSAAGVLTPDLPQPVHL
jgi:hypothetical protein